MIELAFLTLFIICCMVIALAMLDIFTRSKKRRDRVVMIVLLIILFADVVFMTSVIFEVLKN